MENKPGTESTPGSHERLALRTKAQYAPETWRRTYNELPGSAQGLRNGTRNWIPVQPRKVQKN